jgi:hypothetical protein
MTTISGVSGGAHGALLPEVDVQEGTFTSIATEVAVLLLETQENQKQSEREQLSLARQEFSRALDDQVTALKAEADAGFRGALVQGGLALAGCGMSLWGIGRESKTTTWQEKLGDGLDHLAEPLGKAAGTNYGAANAKSAEGEAEAAKWQLDDARQALRDANASQGKALDWLGSMVDRDAATMSAILANKV